VNGNVKSMSTTTTTTTTTTRDRGDRYGPIEWAQLYGNRPRRHIWRETHQVQSFNRICQVSPIWISIYYTIPWPQPMTVDHQPKRQLERFSRLLHARCGKLPMCYIAPHHPLKKSLLVGDVEPI